MKNSLKWKDEAKLRKMRDSLMLEFEEMVSETTEETEDEGTADQVGH